MLYPRGHLHRIWLVLGAVNSLSNPTLVRITKATGLPKPTVNDALTKLMDGQVAGVTVEKQGSEYQVTEWLDFKEAVTKIYIENGK